MQTQDVHEANHWIKRHGDLILDTIRIYLGFGLILKAVFFVYHMDYLLRLTQFTGSTWFAPTIVAHYIVMAHFCGGVCLVLGLFTRLAAILQLPILIAAIFYVHMPTMYTSVEARQSVEFSALVLLLLALISVYGAGRLSLDYWLGRKTDADLFHDVPAATKAA